MAATEKQQNNKTLAHGVGKRKRAVARIWLKRGAGEIIINGRPYKDYFDTDASRAATIEPFNVYPAAATRYSVHANVRGGGVRGQADAVKTGIARALLEANSELRPLLKSHGLLRIDARKVERKKYGQRGARRKFQFVKR